VPLIEIRALPWVDRARLADVARTLNREVAAAIPCRLDAVWTTWRSLDGYAVGDVVAEQQPEESHAPVVHLYVNRPPDAVERICEVIEEVLCRELPLAAGNVFITVQPVFSLPGA
jgi:hypothetical protein